VNIFILDSDPVIAAQSQCDKHVVKMILETAQLLSTAVIETGGKALYKPTHANHPCAIWARKSQSNFKWLKRHGLALCEEYTNRYGKVHAAEFVIISCLDKTIPEGPLTEFAVAMPEYCKTGDPVESYKKYYICEKSKMAKWKHGNIPIWYTLGTYEEFGTSDD